MPNLNSKPIVATPWIYGNTPPYPLRSPNSWFVRTLESGRQRSHVAAAGLQVICFDTMLPQCLQAEHEIIEIVPNFKWEDDSGKPVLLTFIMVSQELLVATVGGSACTPLSRMARNHAPGF